MSSFLRLNISPNNPSASDILGDAEDSEAAYSCLMMGKEAGCSLICMVEIHQSDRCLKVQVPRSWLYKGNLAQMSILFKVPGCTNSISRFYILQRLRERCEEFSMSNHALNTTRRLRIISFQSYKH